jgi:hypothetical protein
MAAVASVVEVVTMGVRRQVNTLTRFLTEPVGVFETVDTIVRNARITARSLLETVGIRPGVLLRVG